MEEIISKEEIEYGKNVLGEIRGSVPKIITKYVIDQKGWEGLKKLEDLLKQLGCPIDYKNINQINFYPAWITAITFLAVDRLFNFTEEEFRKIGETDTKVNPLVRIFMKFVVSPKKAAESASKIWPQYHTVGKLELIEFNEKEKYSILRLTDFNLNKHHCQYLTGVFIGVSKLSTGRQVTCQETKCISKGDKYHEFFTKW